MALTQRDRRAVLIGLALLGLALLGRFVVMPAYGHWRDVRAAAVAQDEQLTQIERTLNRRDAVFDRLRSKYGDAVDAELLDVDQTRVVFPKAIEQALQQSGVAVQSIDLQAVRRVRQVSGVSMVSLRVRATCKPTAISKLLKALRETDRITVVERLDLTMANPGRRDQWTVGLVVATPALEGTRS